MKIDRMWIGINELSDSNFNIKFFWMLYSNYADFLICAGRKQLNELILINLENFIQFILGK